MTRQTAAPLQRLPIDTSNRQARGLARQVANGEIDINPPYQRGPVWSDDQRVALMLSLLSGTPVPSIIVNDRHGRHWTDLAVYDRRSPSGASSYVVIDGKQRLLCLTAWFAGDLAIPASWVEAGMIDQAEDTDDGLYVRSTGLTEFGRRSTGERILVPVGEAKVATLREEAAIYLLVNGAGTPQSDADMANARTVAEGTR